MDKTIPMQFERAICPICNINHQHGGIAFGTTFVSPEEAKRKEELMKNATHFANCKDCQKRLNDGYYAIIAIDTKLSTDSIPFRTGLLLWVHNSFAPKVFNDETIMMLIAQGYVYADAAIVAVLQSIQNGRN